MNPWIAKIVILVGTVVMIVIRAPHGRRSRSVKVARSHKTPLETLLLVLAWVGFFVPLIWVVSPAFSFAEYPLRTGPLVVGLTCLAIGLWLFFRSHADLGTNWSVTLELRQEHRLITHGVYRAIRHPMVLGANPLCRRSSLGDPELGGRFLERDRVGGPPCTAPGR